MDASTVQAEAEDAGPPSKGDEQCWAGEEEVAVICKEYWSILWQTAIVVMLLYMLVKKEYYN